MLVLSESSPQLPPSSSAADLRKATEAARLTGCRVYNIPPDFSQCETAENALAHVPTQEQETPAIWIGYIPAPSHYQAIYGAALEKRVRLLNNPEQHLDAQEFDRAYPRLAELTPLSVTITSEEQCAEVVQTFGLALVRQGCSAEPEVARLESLCGGVGRRTSPPLSPFADIGKPLSRAGCRAPLGETASHPNLAGGVSFRA